MFDPALAPWAEAAQELGREHHELCTCDQCNFAFEVFKYCLRPIGQED